MFNVGTISNDGSRWVSTNKVGFEQSEIGSRIAFRVGENALVLRGDGSYKALQEPRYDDLIFVGGITYRKNMYCIVEEIFTKEEMSISF